MAAATRPWPGRGVGESAPRARHLGARRPSAVERHNFAVSALVARQLGAELFGAFSLAFATYHRVLNVERSLGTEPHAIRYSGAADARWEEAARRTLGLSVVVGCLGAGVVLVVGLVVDGPVGQAHLALAPVLPGLLLQDGWRFVFLSTGRGRSAFANDLWWTLALALVGTLVAGVSGTAVGYAIGAWVGALYWWQQLTTELHRVTGA